MTTQRRLCETFFLDSSSSSLDFFEKRDASSSSIEARRRERRFFLRDERPRFFLCAHTHTPLCNSKTWAVGGQKKSEMLKNKSEMYYYYLYVGTVNICIK